MGDIIKALKEVITSTGGTAPNNRDLSDHILALPFGGGGGGAEPVVFTINEDETITCNKTFTECVDCFNKGANATFIIEGNLMFSSIVQFLGEIIWYLFLMPNISDNEQTGGKDVSFEVFPIIYNADGTIILEM